VEKIINLKTTGITKIEHIHEPGIQQVQALADVLHSAHGWCNR